MPHAVEVSAMQRAARPGRATHVEIDSAQCCAGEAAPSNRLSDPPATPETTLRSGAAGLGTRGAAAAANPQARRGEARRATGPAASDLASRAAALSSRAPPRAPPRPSALLQRQRSGVARRAEAGRCRPVRARHGWGHCAERAGGWDVTRRTACGCCLALPVCHAPRVEGPAQPLSLSPSAHHLRAQAGRRSEAAASASRAQPNKCTAARLRAEWPKHTARLHDERACKKRQFD